MFRFIVRVVIGTIISVLAGFGAQYLGATHELGNLVLFVTTFAIQGLVYWAECDLIKKYS